MQLLKMVENDYVVLIQDDMVVREKDFDKRMLEPFVKYNYYKIMK